MKYIPEDDRWEIESTKKGMIQYYASVQHLNSNQLRCRIVSYNSKYNSKEIDEILDVSHLKKLISYKSIHHFSNYVKKHKLSLNDNSNSTETPVDNHAVNPTASTSFPPSAVPHNSGGQGIFFDKDKDPIDPEQLIFCDTETTGLDKNAEICEISLVDYWGNVLLDTLVKPTNPIPPEATKVHGITNTLVANSPTFDIVWGQFRQIVEKKHIVFYNRQFDQRMIIQSVFTAFPTDTKHLLPHNVLQSFFTPQTAPRFHCLMMYYARYWGEWSDYHGNYKWQSLINACKQQKIPIDDLPNHRALGDTVKTLRLYHSLERSIKR